MNYYLNKHNCYDADYKKVSVEQLKQAFKEAEDESWSYFCKIALCDIKDDALYLEKIFHDPEDDDLFE